MSPDERQMISDLFERMRSFGQVDKDRDADTLILQSMRQTPDAGYKLVQSVLVQENALQDAEARMQDLEQQIAQLQADLAQAQQPRQQPSGGGGFLGGIFGGKQQAPAPTSVPVSGRSAGFGNAQPQQQAGSPWGRSAAPQQGYQQPQQGYQQPMQQQAPAAGGGFMKSALTTAAGVAGGVLAAGAIRDMMSGGSSAQASGHRNSDQQQASSPYEVNQEPQQQVADQGQGYGYQSEESNDPGNEVGGGSDDLDI